MNPIANWLWAMAGPAGLLAGKILLFMLARKGEEKLSFGAWATWVCAIVQILAVTLSVMVRLYAEA